jgi:hypothetical protein
VPHFGKRIFLAPGHECQLSFPLLPNFFTPSRGLGGISEGIFQIGFSQQNFKILHVSSRRIFSFQRIGKALTKRTQNTESYSPNSGASKILPVFYRYGIHFYQHLMALSMLLKGLNRALELEIFVFRSSPAEFEKRISKALTFEGERDILKEAQQGVEKGGFDGRRKKIKGSRNHVAAATQASGELCDRSSDWESSLCRRTWAL